MYDVYARLTEECLLSTWTMINLGSVSYDGKLGGSSEGAYGQRRRENINQETVSTISADSGACSLIIRDLIITWLQQENLNYL